jgi:hypothetical protein
MPGLSLQCVIVSQSQTGLHPPEHSTCSAQITSAQQQQQQQQQQRRL